MENNYWAENTNEKLTEEIPEDKIENIEINNNNNNKKNAYIYLSKALGWIFVTLLSVIFGIFAIFTFIGSGGVGNESSLFGFIFSIKNDYSWTESAKYFGQMIQYSFEAGLFLFFIIYSTKISFKNLMPFLKWKKLTEPPKLEQKLIAIKQKQKQAILAALTNGLDIKEKNYSEKIDIKKEINLRTKETNKIIKKIKDINKK